MYAVLNGEDPHALGMPLIANRHLFQYGSIFPALSLHTETKVDFPPLTGPINNRIRFRTSNLFAAGWKYSSTKLSNDSSRPNS